MLDSILKLIQGIFSLPTFGNWIAFSAFAVSLFGLVWTRKATQISQQALAHAKTESEKSERLETEMKRTELLCAISNEKALLMAIRLELGVLKANHEYDHPTVKTLLQNFSQIFDFLPQIEFALSQLDQLYLVVATTTPAGGPIDILKLSAEQHRISKDTEYFIKCCTDSLPTFIEKRELAIQAHRRSTLTSGDA